MGIESKVGKKNLALLTTTTALFFGVNYALAVAENNPNRTWQTEPHLSFDDWDWALRRPFMMTPFLARGKLTHNEAWLYWPVKSNFQGVRISGIPGGMRRVTVLDAILISLGEWDQVYKIEPEKPGTDWKFAWGVPETGWGQELRIIPRKGVPLLVLAGPDDWTAYGFEKTNPEKEVKLKISGPFYRYDPFLEGDPI